MEIKNNISIYDGALRLIAAVIIAGVAGAFSSLLGLIAVPLIVSSLAAWCPVYSIMGINTATATADFSIHAESHNAVKTQKEPAYSLTPSTL